jgi:hypothetical protein
VQRALAQASNLMIGDDHDVADDFGDRTEVIQQRHHQRCR